jgi:hypothetical protein
MDPVKVIYVSENDMHKQEFIVFCHPGQVELWREGN